MGLKNLLEQEKTAVIKQWFDVMVNTYSPDAAQFMKNQKDQFANPVGCTFSQNLEALYDELTGDMDQQKIITALDGIVRIRAIQDFSPSRAVAFIFALKDIARKRFSKKLNDEKGMNELLSFESKIDYLTMTAFDIYMGCRENLYNIKANQEKTKVYKAFKRAGLVVDLEDDKPDLVETNI